MKRGTVLLIAASAIALGACGSHSKAPIVYGTDPASTGRVYNSPEDYARVNNTARPSASQVYASQGQAPRATTKPAALTPVTSAEISKMEIPAAPTYISLSNDAPAQSNARASSDRTVTVKPGDTVYAISRRTGASPNAIIAENRLRAPYSLEVGQTLRIPDPEQKIANNVTARQPVMTEVRPRNVRTHIVHRGDTLSSISRSTGVPVHTLASANNLRAPYELKVGQALTVPGVASTATANPEAAPDPRDVENLARTVSYTPPAATNDDPSRLFDWPVKGAIIGKFGAGVMGKRNDGINIAAPVGTPVHAAADGEVVYRGSELDGYGNLLLVKHADGYVTAYAHNDVMLVQKGQKVNKGQVIAKVGKTGAASEPQLHFEIRQNLKSVDPLGFLDN